MSIELGENNTYKLKFQHGNLIITTPPQNYTILPNNDIKVSVEYGSYIAYVAMENFKYDFSNLHQFAEQIESVIKTKLDELKSTNLSNSSNSSNSSVDMLIDETTSIRTDQKTEESSNSPMDTTNN